MIENKNVYTIGKKVNMLWLRHFIFFLVLINFIIFLLAFISWVEGFELEYSSNNWYVENKNRRIKFDNYNDDNSDINKSTNNELIYSFENKYGILHKIPIYTFLKYFLKYFLLLIIIEILILLIIVSHGKYKTIKRLKPISDIAKTAEQLSKLNISQQKYKNLATAIEHLSPNSRLNLYDSELKVLEDAVNQLIERLHKSYEQQNQFVSDASHELRTPIAVIQGYVNMLHRWGKDDEKVLDEAIEAIKCESNYMKVLIEQLLFLARGDSEKNNIPFTKVDITSLLKEIYDEYSMIDENHIWKQSIESNCMVLGDYALLKQAIRILVDNAIKYSSEHTPITLKCIKNDHTIICSVQDNGMGICRDDIPKIYNRFFRSDPARNRKSGGTGLGLSIAKWIVDKHSGYFTVTSFENIGSIISIHIPENKNIN